MEWMTPMRIRDLGTIGAIPSSSVKRFVSAAVLLVVLPFPLFLIMVTEGDLSAVVGPSLMALLMGLAPTAVYYFWVKNQTAVLLCGGVMVATTIPAWVSLYIPSDPLESLWAFVVFIVTLSLAGICSLIKPRGA